MPSPTPPDALSLRYGLNDLRRNAGVTAALSVVLVLTAALLTGGALAMERLTGSIDQLFDQARPPHFLQMHVGAYDPAALDAFAADHPQVRDWLVEEMVGFDSAALSWTRPGTGEGGSFAASVIDNLFVAQNEGFDLLLGPDGRAARPAPGEVFLPVAQQRTFGVRAGDVLTVQTLAGPRDLTVAGFVRDAQMASSLSSATRLLVTPEDLAALNAAGGGAPEIIVEYRLDDPAGAAALQAAYERTPDLPRNGQAITYDMIRLINTFSDGLVAIALMFVSLVLMVIALLNLRFVIRGTLEDEVRQIGVMKAIGLPNATIVGLHLARYRLMAAGSCLIGGALGIGAAQALSAAAAGSYAAAPITPATILIPLAALVAVYLITVGMCRGVLRGVRRVQVVDALVHGSLMDDRRTAATAARQARLARRGGLAHGRLGLAARLALRDLRADARQWALLPAVFGLAAIVMILPTTLLSTFTDPRFVTYLGAPDADLRADLAFSPTLDADRDRLVAAWASDPRVTDVRPYATVLFQARGAEGWEALRAEVGDYTGATVSFAEGRAPVPGEIALSHLNASKLGLATGDTLTLRRGDAETSVRISGTYSDVTSGGYTAKLPGEVTHDASAYVVYADAAGGADAEALAADLAAASPAASVIGMREYTRQTLAHITDAFARAAAVAVGFGLGVATLITVLFLKLRLARERRSLGVLSALGFSGRELAAQLRLKTLLTAGAGTALGVVLAATAGDALVGTLVSAAGLGVARFTLLPDVPLTYLAYPLGLLAAALIGAQLLGRGLRRADKSRWLA
ncbi:ABC transporter permease [Propioniciclava coleopterorum]|uniref:ABC transporter permease n=1 Tax=Propioniciclava coleopterorum TaxID=2714937 RepID=A0A6G7Y3Q4_9ACTN|nr:ABC transporter permease [Propioniciclava coleopterorum]QIK71442.1 ABC transporter permease [Propioniciclava coleopterorum]